MLGGLMLGGLMLGALMLGGLRSLRSTISNCVTFYFNLTTIFIILFHHIS